MLEVIITQLFFYYDRILYLVILIRVFRFFSPVVSRPPSPKSDTEYENQKIDTVTPTDSSAPSWGWGQLPNVPRKISEAQAPSGISADAKNESEQNKDDDSAVGEQLFSG